MVMRVITERILVYLMDSSREKGIKLLIDVSHVFFLAKIGGDSIGVFMQYFL
jgi:hypothetical protein